MKTSAKYAAVQIWGRAEAPAVLSLTARDMMVAVPGRAMLVKADGRKVEAAPVFVPPTVHKVKAPKQLARIV